LFLHTHPSPTAIYTLSLHDALPIYANFDTGSYLQFAEGYFLRRDNMMWFWDQYTTDPAQRAEITAAPLNATLKDLEGLPPTLIIDRKSTRLNSSHLVISYAVFCLKK